MTHTPRVSVLLPVRDAGPHLETCLRSLDRQTLDGFEVVAIDDGSSDGSGERLDAWARGKQRRTIVHRPAEGLVSALNTGLEHCRGELVARMDADDAAARRRLELQLAFFDAHPDVDVVSCLVTHFPRLGVAEGFRIYERWLNRLRSHEEILRERFVESPIPHPTVMLPLQLYREAGGYRDRNWPEDYDLWLRLAERGARFAKVPRQLYFWRDHSTRATRTDGRYAVERFLECKAHHLARGPLRGVGRVIVWGAGQTGKRLSRALQRRGVSIEAFLDVDPKKIGGELRGRPVHAPEDLPELLRDRDGAVVLAAVASRGARGLIRERLAEMGLNEARDYWCVA